MEPSQVSLPVNLLAEEEAHPGLERWMQYGKVAHLGRDRERRVTLERQHLPEPYDRPHALPLGLERTVSHEPVAQCLSGRVRDEHLAAHSKRLDPGRHVDDIP